MTRLQTDEQREQLANRHDNAANASAKLLTAGRAATSPAQEVWFAFHESLHLFHTQRARELRDGWL